jgi:hypothetical protein
MTTSQQTFTLSKPVGDDPVPAGTLGYFRARNKQKVYGLVLKEFKKSGLSQADLARRLRKAPEVVCRLLGSPGNWTLDTVSDFLFAISAAEPKYDLMYPLDKSLPQRHAGSPVMKAAAPPGAPMKRPMRSLK